MREELRYQIKCVSLKIIKNLEEKWERTSFVCKSNDSITYLLGIGCRILRVTCMDPAVLCFQQVSLFVLPASLDHTLTHRVRVFALIKEELAGGFFSFIYSI